MEFRIADTFTDSLARLTNEEQKAVKTTAFDLQVNPASPGMQFHKLDRAKDQNFWSVRVSRDIRLIVHRTSSSLLLCYVDHHDDAYRWAEKRKLETHPKTGAAQLVEIRETIKEIEIPRYKEVERTAKPKPLLFDKISEDELLSFGVPLEWITDVRKVNEDSLLDLATHLPSEAAEALLDLATGATPKVSQPAPPTQDPFEHPDAQRRFRIMSNVEELERALEYPWEKWAIFLHPSQREIVDRDFNGAARVAGSAGTGKTIVALHRAVFLVRKNPEARVLLTTFSETLANALRNKLKRLISNEPRLGERIEVHSMNGIGNRLYEIHFGKAAVAGRTVLKQTIGEAADKAGEQRFSRQFLLSEWEDVVDAWQLSSWDEYKDVVRLGRKTRLPETQRALLWKIFEAIKASLKSKKLITQSEVFSQLAIKLASAKHPPFEFAVVDESQDISVAQLKFLKSLGGDRQNSLFFAGDLGQRIFQAPFSWKSLGVDIRGRSKILHINYRTSHQIRQQADKLLGPEVSDVDGNTEDRRGTISVFNGPSPSIVVAKSEAEEIKGVANWIKERIAEGLNPHELGIFVRSDNEIARARAAVEKAGVPATVLDENVETKAGIASISTMHLAKGLEFRAVAVMACDDEILPQQSRIETASDESDLEEVYNTERHLLYVACTRARDYLLISSVEPSSEFLGDLKYSNE
jgi:mRNA-degrading endonuclease RelE of RelBE toxin-antitoxin system